MLRPELAQELDRIGRAEIVVGIPSFNNARTIEHVVRAVGAGLAKYYPDLPCLLVNSDGGSSDGTPDVVLQADTGEYRTLLLAHRTQPLHRLSTGYLGVPGKGSALRTILTVAARVGARACLVVDSDLRSINPEWVHLLLEPVLRHGVDFVAPLYSRHKYDGTITNSIVYPLTRALYGKRVRQPIGGDFGLSGALAAHYVEGHTWEDDVARYGVDVWMTTRAIAGGYQVAQSYLGAKIHDTKDPGADLTAMFTQVVGTVFDLMGRYRAVWDATRGSVDVPTFGFRYTVGVEPVQVNVDRMVAMFRQGAADLMPVWRAIFTPPTCAALARAADDGGAEAFPPELWVRAVYEAAVGYHGGVLPRQHLLRAMIPLYLGRTAAFVRQTATSGGEEVEAEIERLCELYETLRPYLIERWDDRRR
ncbi:MAG: glycosyl transferase family 2 [Gemmatimonadetes bacterium]|nr:glycosyl transferase family 2 [Gemmatimonadota bacterium]